MCVCVYIHIYVVYIHIYYIYFIYISKERERGREYKWQKLKQKETESSILQAFSNTVPNTVEHLKYFFYKWHEKNARMGIVRTIWKIKKEDLQILGNDFREFMNETMGILHSAMRFILK